MVNNSQGFSRNGRQTSERAVWSNARAWKPRPLTPNYEIEKHEGYVLKLLQLISDENNRNIALTGAYGTGKSSIIDGVIRYINALNGTGSFQWSPTAELEKHIVEKLYGIKPIVVSLPTLHKSLVTSSTVRPTEVQQATTPTNNIQREIVKHLLYREPPERMRHSNFRRLFAQTKPRQALTYGLLSIIAVLIVAGFQGHIGPDGVASFIEAWWFYGAVFGTVFIAAWALDWLVIYKPIVRALSTGNTKIELEKGSVSYFDQYLDEIIYYFQQSGTNLVVFEDLDRYGQPYIFETLKELNELLNVSLQSNRVKSGWGSAVQPVRFVFATKDSALVPKEFLSLKEPQNEDDTSEPQESQLEGGFNRDSSEPENRIKFFDALVPVVPFSTSRNAFEHLHSELKQTDSNGEGPVTRELLELVGSEIVDFRVLNNVINEFQIYAEELTGSTGESVHTQNFLELDALFAMIAYKAISPEQFELVPSGKSQIDAFDNAFRLLQADFIAFLRRRRALLQRQVRAKEVSEKRAIQLGEQVQAYLDTVSSARNFSQIRIDDLEFKATEIQSAHLWSEYFKAAGNEAISLKFISSYNSDSIVPAAFVSLVANTLYGFDVFESSHLSEIKDELAEIQVLDKAVRFASYKNFPLILERHEVSGVREFLKEYNRLVKKCFPHQLTEMLVRRGYIDGTYHLYTSNFISGMNSPEAQSFLTLYLERDEPRPGLSLTENAVKEIAHQIGKYPRYLDSIAIYNGSLFAELVVEGKNQEKAQSIAKRMSEESFPADLAKEFVLSLLQMVAVPTSESEDGHKAKTALIFIARYQNAILSIALTDGLDSIPDEQAIALLDSTVRGLNGGKYFCTQESIDLFLNYYPEVPALAKDSNLPLKNIEALATELRISETQVPDISRLHLSLQKSLIENGVFEVNRQNVASMISLESGFDGLDAISNFEAAFKTVVAEADQYIAEMQAIERPLFTSSVCIGPTLTKLFDVEGDTGKIKKFARAAAGHFKIDDVTVLSEKIVGILLTNGLIDENARNLAYLIRHLNSESNAVEFSEDQVVSFVRDARELQPSGDAEDNALSARFLLQHDLVSFDRENSLNRLKPLEIEENSVGWSEVGKLIPDKVWALYRSGIMFQEEEGFAQIKGVTHDWSIIECYLLVSEAQEWLSAELLDSVATNGSILASTKLPLALRQFVLSAVNESEVEVNEENWFSIVYNSQPKDFMFTSTQIEFAAEHTNLSSWNEVQVILNHTLELYSRNEHFSEVEQILYKLGGQYSQLIKPGRNHLVFPDSETIRKILELVQEQLGVVSKWESEQVNKEGTNRLRVYRRHKV